MSRAAEGTRAGTSVAPKPRAPGSGSAPPWPDRAPIDLAAGRRTDRGATSPYCVFPEAAVCATPNVAREPAASGLAAIRSARGQSRALLSTCERSCAVMYSRQRSRTVASIETVSRTWKCRLSRGLFDFFWPMQPMHSPVSCFAVHLNDQKSQHVTDAITVDPRRPQIEGYRVTRPIRKKCLDSGLEVNRELREPEPATQPPQCGVKRPGFRTSGEVQKGHRPKQDATTASTGLHDGHQSFEPGYSSGTLIEREHMSTCAQAPLYGVGDLVRMLELPLHRIDYLLESRAIRPVCRVGGHRAFDQAALDLLRAEITKGHRKRGRKHGG